MSMRFHLPPGGDVPPIVAARRLGLSLEQFRAKLPELALRNFPPADPTTGNYDLDAVDAWRRARYPQVFGGPLTLVPGARDAKNVVRERIRGIRGG